ncbi:hypothetical protein LZ554_003332 [Drepanopeziza brunnea f. sp. 'monogermtubi']|nr:hypothetical protein LZ554_003332 [Drepanopeziza brunnea f. sp. 'monogermtubi']
MQPGGQFLAEVSSFKKLHSSQNASHSCSPQFHDVEKAGVNDGALPSTKQPVVEAQPNPSPNEKGQNNAPKADVSSQKGEEKDDFPEGGLRGWLVVLGAFCGNFSVFGIVNCTAILHDYFSTHQLKDNSPSQIGWIFGLALFLTFFCGAPIGPIFDSYGPRALILCGSILLIASMFLLGTCTQYWHFIMVYSVLNGIGGCLINTPCIASIGHFFLKKRGNATGIAMTSGSIGGIIFPLLLEDLFPKVGFAWATRILGFILAFLLIIANFLVRSRLPRKPMASFKSIAPQFSLFLDVPFAFTSVGIFLMEWGIFVPLTYITSHSASHGHSSAFGFHILAILNGGSFFGRFFAGVIADMIGRLNTLILSILMCVVTCLALWLPAGGSAPMVIVFAIIFGFVSGSNLSLSPVCVGQLCKTENYGRYYTTCWMFVAFGTLTSLPIAGQLLTVMHGDYTGLIIFTALSYAAAGVFLIAARVLKVGWKLNVVF